MNLGSHLSREDVTARLVEIDKMFEGATGWGSWMVSVANEREAIVNYANGRWNLDIEHKHQARTASGERTD